MAPFCVLKKSLGAYRNLLILPNQIGAKIKLL